ncbi:MAG: undecaprenyl diphosphate synthase family protein [Acidimicrobiaceae bacterium]|nr:undecaprenyl diphosphate synthase family protein [Ilumatobacter sp.]MCB9379820.1 undecaprenyl diphosphate synthase family protein [Acidimicrobiaceae bacterium]MCO5328947.1 undecaprenyl diphosphate synthase family protein [Ilumatobacteraceae bacterium]
MTEPAPAPRHVIVVVGTVEEWSALPETAWDTLLDDLGKAADHAGTEWLIVRPTGGSGGDGVVRERQVGGCLVLADPEGDGRVRVAGAAERLRAAGEAITEEAVSAALNRPAETDPDLVVVDGPSHRLPTSLVWELAYSELVFVDVPFTEFGARHLEHAVAAFTHRHRRFGGID